MSSHDAFPVNDGARPSRLDLDARATGEQPGPVPDAHQATLDAARAQTPVFDMAILRARAHRIEQDEAAAAAPTAVLPSLSWWRWLGSRGGLSGMGAAVAMAAALLVSPLLSPGDGNRTRGAGGEAEAEAYLDTFVLRSGEGEPWSPDMRLSEGDRVQFAYDAQGQGETLVLLSIDGEGGLSIFWPETGDTPVPAQPLGMTLLEGSVELDDARGPEVFVAVFGAETVTAARKQVWARWTARGLAGLRALDREDPRVDVVVIEKEE